jgi:hypothetical protein
MGKKKKRTAEQKAVSAQNLESFKQRRLGTVGSADADAEPDPERGSADAASGDVEMADSGHSIAGAGPQEAMQTDDTAQPMQPQPSEVPPASPPPPTHRLRLACLTPNARVRTLGSDCAGWQAAGAAGAAATVLDPPSATAQLPASQVSPF